MFFQCEAVSDSLIWLFKEARKAADFLRFSAGSSTTTLESGLPSAELVSDPASQGSWVRLTSESSDGMQPVKSSKSLLSSVVRLAQRAPPCSAFHHFSMSAYE